MPDNLRQKTTLALFWSFAEIAGQRIVQFVIGIALARLLFPEQFGLIGMLAIFIAVSQSFLDSGFGAALIQKREATQTDICSIFYFNIAVGIVAAGLLFLIAPWVAVFYKQPILTPLMRALSLTIVINSFGLIQNTMLTRQINFKVTTKVSLVAVAVSGLVGITLAYTGFGVWSLAVQQVSYSFLRTACLWFFSAWRPSLIFSFNALRSMFGFGSRILFSGVLNRVFDNIYYLVIGRLFSAADLGYFTRAKTMNDLPSQTLSGIVGRVAFPVFSTIQDDKVRLKRGLKKALINLVFVNFPMMIGLAIIARPLVLFLLTEKWVACVPYFRLLCAAGLLYPLHMMNLNVLQAMGRSDLFFRLEILKKAMIAINIAVTWQWGISAMIWGMIIMSFIGLYLNCHYNGVLIGYPIGEQISDLLPYLAVSVLMGAGVYALSLLWAALFIQVTAGILIYIGLCRTFHLSAFMDMWQAVLDRAPFARAETASK